MNVGLDRELSLLLGGVIQVMFVIGIYPLYTAYRSYLCPTLTIH